MNLVSILSKENDNESPFSSIVCFTLRLGVKMLTLTLCRFRTTMLFIVVALHLKKNTSVCTNFKIESFDRCEVISCHFFQQLRIVVGRFLILNSDHKSRR